MWVEVTDALITNLSEGNVFAFLHPKVGLLMLCGCFKFHLIYLYYRKRSVSEMQMMHNLGEHLHSANRQNWLLEKLQTVHHDPQANEAAGAVDVKAREVRSWRLLPDDLQAKLQKKAVASNKNYRDATFKTRLQ